MGDGRTGDEEGLPADAATAMFHGLQRDPSPGGLPAGLSGRMRSASPCRRALAMEMRRLATLVRQPAEGQHHGAMHAPAGLQTGGSAPSRGSSLQQQLSAVADQALTTQRQCDSDRRRLFHLERRVEGLGEERARDNDSRERLAEVQGRVTGLLEETQALSLRLDALDERVWARTSVSGLSKQRSRELEQQVQLLEQQQRLATVANEDLQRRQGARMRKVEARQDELIRKMELVEAELGARGAGRQPNLVEALNVLQQQQDQLVMDVQSLQDQFEEAVQGLGVYGDTNGSSPVDFAAAREVTEQGLIQLEKRFGAQIEDLASSVANLQVKVNGHVQRSTTMAERLQSTHEPLMESLRNEVAHARTQGRREMDQELAVLQKHIQHLEQRLDEFAGVDAVHGDFDAQLQECQKEIMEIREYLCENASERIQNDDVAVEEATQRFSIGALEAIQGRLEALEERYDLQGATLAAETGAAGDSRSSTSDARLSQAQNSICQLREELGKLRDRDSKGESRLAGLQQQVQNLQAVVERHQAEQERPTHPYVELDVKLEQVTKKVVDLTARLVEVEGVTECARESELTMSDGQPSFLPHGGRGFLAPNPAAEVAGRGHQGCSRGFEEANDANLQQLQEQVQLVASHLEMVDDLVVRLAKVEQGHEEIAEVLQEAQWVSQEAKRVVQERSRSDLHSETSDPSRGRDPMPSSVERAMREMESVRVQASELMKTIPQELMKTIPQELEQIRLMKVEFKNSLRDLESRGSEATSRIEKLEKSKDLLQEGGGEMKDLQEEVEMMKAGLEDVLEQGQAAVCQEEIDKKLAQSPLLKALEDRLVAKLEAELTSVIMREDVHDLVTPLVKEELESTSTSIRHEVEKAGKEQVESFHDRLARTLDRVQNVEEKAMWLEHECQRRAREEASPNSELKESIAKLRVIEGRLHSLEESQGATELNSQVSKLGNDVAEQEQLIAEHRRELDGTLASLQGLSDRLGALSSLPDKVEKLATEKAEEAATLSARMTKELSDLAERQSSVEEATASLKVLSDKVDALMRTPGPEPKAALAGVSSDDEDQRIQKMETSLDRLRRDMDQLLGTRKIGIIAGESSPGAGSGVEVQSLREQLDTVTEQVKDIQERLPAKVAAATARKAAASQDSGSDSEGSLNFSLTEHVDDSLTFSLTDLTMPQQTATPAESSAPSSAKATEQPSSTRSAIGGPQGTNQTGDALDRALGLLGQQGGGSTSSASTYTPAPARSGRSDKRKATFPADDSADSRLSPVAEEGDAVDDGLLASAATASSSRAGHLQGLHSGRLGASASLAESTSGDSLGVSYSYSCQEMSLGVDFSVEDSTELEKCDHIEEVQPMSISKVAAGFTDPADSAGGASSTSSKPNSQPVAAGSSTSAVSAAAAQGAAAAGIPANTSAIAGSTRSTSVGIVGTSDIASSSPQASLGTVTSTGKSAGNAAVRISSTTTKPAAADEAWDSQDQSNSYNGESWEEEDSVEESIAEEDEDASRAEDKSSSSST